MNEFVKLKDDFFNYRVFLAKIWNFLLNTLSTKKKSTIFVIERTIEILRIIVAERIFNFLKNVAIETAKKASN